jgi:hypothetical protein
MRVWLVLAVGLLIPASGLAQALFSSEGPSINRRVRNLGMGNVGVAIKGTGDSSPFYNPAGLNDLTEARYQFLTMTFDMAKDSIGMIGDLKDLTNDLDGQTTDSGKVGVLDKFIQGHTGEFQHVRFGLDLFNYARKNFAVGFTIDERLDVSFRDQSFPHFDVRNVGDAAIFISGSHDFWEKLLQIGFTVRPTVRFALDQADEEVTYADVVNKNTAGKSVLKDQFKKIKDRRFALAVDVGAKSDMAKFENIPGFKYLKPSVGVTWQDIGSPNFHGADPNRSSVSAGFAVFPDVWKLKNTVAMDFRDLNHKEDFVTRLHFGAESEYRWTKIGFGLRAGVNQGYFTAGLTADLWLVKLDGAYYSEEIGIKTKQDGNTRFAVTLSFNI